MFTVVSILFVIVSMLEQIVVSMPEVKSYEAVQVLENTTAYMKRFTDEDLAEYFVICYPTTFVEYISVAWFTLEFILRLLASPNVSRYFVEPLTIVDLLSFLPSFYMLLLLSVVAVIFYELQKVNDLFILVCRITQAFKVLRLLRLARYSVGLQVSVTSFKISSLLCWSPSKCYES